MGVIETETHFIAVDGPHEASISENEVALKMSDVSAVEKQPTFYFADTGSPHYVEFVQDVEDLNVYEKGREVRYNDRFAQEGTNVNFAEKQGSQAIRVRTYERGVEDETLSCGTGVTACALASHLEGMVSPIAIQVQGGELEVSFQEDGNGGYKDIYLKGPAVKVFTGKIDFQ